MWIPGASIGARNIVAPAVPAIAVVLRHDDGELGADRAGDQPFRAVDHEICVAVAARASCAASTGRTPAPGAGSVIMKHERISPAASGRSQSFLLALFGDQFQQVHVGFVGREDVHRHRPERRIAGRLEDDGLARWSSPRPPHSRPTCGRADRPRRPSATSSRRNSSARPVRRLPRVVLVRQDLLAHEALGALLQLGKFVGQRKIHR